MMPGREWLAAMRGDAAASIAIAVEAMPIDQVTPEVDLTMTILTLFALDGDADAALALSHILHRVSLDHPRAQELAISWLMLNLRRALSANRHSAEARAHLKSSNAPNVVATSLNGGMRA